MGQQRYPIYGPEHDACGIGAVVSIQGIKNAVIFHAKFF